MNSLVSDTFTAYVTSMQAAYLEQPWSDIAFGVALVISLAACFFGVRVRSFIASVLCFFVIGIAYGCGLAQTTNIRIDILLCMALSAITAYVAYHYTLFSTAAICGYFAAAIAYVFTADPVICLCAAFIGVAASLFAPKAAVITATSCGGAAGLAYCIFYISAASDWWVWAVSAVLAAAGLFLQVKCFMRKEQINPVWQLNNKSVIHGIHNSGRYVSKQNKSSVNRYEPKHRA